MNYKLAEIGLAPVLLAQGLHVRRVTPKLPEPAGARHGTAGEGEPLRLLIVGDSSAAGVGTETQASALSGQLTSTLAQHFNLSWRLIAKTGYDVQDVLDRIEAARQEDFGVAVVAVGVNDVTRGTSSRQWRKRLGNLCKRLESKFWVQHVLLTPVPPMHAFPALPQPLRWYLGKKAASLNRAMRALTAENKNWECVDPQFPLTREFIAVDGFHPSAAAYSVWAEKMAAAIRQKWQRHMPDEAPQPPSRSTGALGLL
jgi:lysophospholipase L1-like esterase